MPGITERDFVPPREGIYDQYADGKAAKVWEVFIGDRSQRTENYKNFLVGLLRAKGCKRILDVAAGTGVDSIMLLEEGFEVMSCDASDQMLKYALKERWNRRKESGFDNWVIEEANWLTLYDDIKDHVKEGFDAVICLGNSFSHLLDSSKDQEKHKQAFTNFKKCLKPGGMLLIDHRNYDYVMKTGTTPARSIYYVNRHVSDIQTSVLQRSGKPAVIMLDYKIKGNNFVNNDTIRFYFFPHELKVFSANLEEVFGPTSKHKVYGDFKELNDIDNPAYYIHIIENN